MKLNWSLFESKHQGNARRAFENMCYELFCKKFGQIDGIFSFNNNKALETELIKVEDGYIGFQVKYFEQNVKLASRKKELKDSIIKIKNEYADISKLYFYINKAFYPSSKAGQNKPKYICDIESLATENAFQIVWQVESQLFSQLENDRRIKLKYFPSSPVISSVDEHLSVTRTAIIQIEVCKIRHRFNSDNWGEAARLIGELATFREYRNDVISLDIIQFLSEVADLCRHGMTSEVLHEITSIASLYLPDKIGEESSLSYSCVFRAIFTGYSLAYDSIVYLKDLDKLRKVLQFWRNLVRNNKFGSDKRVIEELGKNYQDLLETLQSKNSGDLNHAIELVNLYKQDFKKPIHGVPLLSDDLYYKVVRDRDKAERKKKKL